MYQSTMTLRELRSGAGLTREVLASRLGVAVSTVRNWETGKTRPSIIVAAGLADVLGCSIEDIAYAVRGD